jgi:hypothetical protein
MRSADRCTRADCRPGFRARGAVHAGDVLVVTRLDRLARSKRANLLNVGFFGVRLLRSSCRRRAQVSAAEIVMGFGCRPTRTCQRAPGPASESRQRTKPRGVGHPADQRALWGIGWHRCWGMGPKMLAPAVNAGVGRQNRSRTGCGAQLDYGAIVLTWNLCGPILPSPVVASR